ncbi:hypothetical protein AB6A40_000611 [Gnathostoma spinigerum]|uniref:Bestrophin homolog n=1 Tax=Gnathostoma spinigerum TaxID=75299 RepID=A0ABD6E4H8_9BILA
MVYKMRKSGAIEADILMNCLLQEIRQFRHNLAQLCRYDWVPVPLAYSQVVILAVRLYFFLCLVIRQNVLESAAKKPTIVDLGIPFMTLMQFIFYMGWMKVAEALLNPLGEDEDDLELNYVIDRNLDVGIFLLFSLLVPQFLPEQ